MDVFGEFQVDRCVGCGECFHRCPVMALSLDEARAEVRRLAAGQATRYVLQRCTSCMSCNVMCPNGANPARRILDRWHEDAAREGFPQRARYFTPAHDPNFRTWVVDRLPPDERARVASWANTAPAETVFYPGCNIITSPYLTRTRLLADVPIRGALELCCGEMYFRTGQYEMVAAQAERLRRWHEKIGFTRMIIPCTAGWNMFTNVLPQFGGPFDFEVEHLLPWLWRRFESGELEVKQPLDMTVTIQDSCHAKFFGAEYMDLPRRFLERLGVQVVEQPLCRERTLCCGIGGGFSFSAAYHPWHVTRATVRALRQAGSTGAPAVAAYCAGCLQMLAVGQLVYPSRLQLYHLLELIQMAIGETPPRRHQRRAMTVLAGVTRHQVPLLAKRGRFQPRDLLK